MPRESKLSALPTSTLQNTASRVRRNDFSKRKYLLECNETVTLTAWPAGKWKLQWSWRLTANFSQVIAVFIAMFALLNVVTVNSKVMFIYLATPFFILQTYFFDTLCWETGVKLVEILHIRWTSANTIHMKRVKKHYMVKKPQII